MGDVAVALVRLAEGVELDPAGEGLLPLACLAEALCWGVAAEGEGATIGGSSPRQRKKRKGREGVMRVRGGGRAAFCAQGRIPKFSLSQESYILVTLRLRRVTSPPPAVYRLSRSPLPPPPSRHLPPLSRECQPRRTTRTSQEARSSSRAGPSKSAVPALSPPLPSAQRARASTDRSPACLPPPQEEEVQVVVQAQGRSNGFQLGFRLGLCRRRRRRQEKDRRREAVRRDPA